MKNTFDFVNSAERIEHISHSEDMLIGESCLPFLQQAGVPYSQIELRIPYSNPFPDENFCVDPHLGSLYFAPLWARIVVEASMGIVNDEIVLRVLKRCLTEKEVVESLLATYRLGGYVAIGFLLPTL